jgi:serine/threonine protein kinase
LGGHLHSSGLLISEVSSLNGAAELVSMRNESLRNESVRSLAGPESIKSIGGFSYRPESVKSIAGVSFKPSKEMAHMLRLALVARDLTVTLLDYSRGPDGKPGRENDEFFIVMELADMSLEEYIEARHRAKQPFSVDEVRCILHDVTRMVCLLHAHGLAHLDVKPANIMLFQSTSWKLIDFDGCFSASSLVDVVESDIAFTPLYCAPEIARVIVKMTEKLKISRHMDVWSVGAIAAELVLMRPVFEPKFNQLYDRKTHDDTRFLEWLAGPSFGVDKDKLEDFDKDLASLVVTRMLVADLSKRASLPEVLRHPFLAHHRPTKRSWAFVDHGPQAKTDSPKTTRILPIQRDDMVLDGTHGMDSDDVAALVSADGLSEGGEHGLDHSPMLSPGSIKNSKRKYRLICCNVDEKTS